MRTPQKLTDGAGQVVWSARYQPFGEASIEVGYVVQNLRFPGQYYDEESGLHYNYQQYYDPGTGRYLTSDPIGLQGGLNTYTYVENNPINLIDPKGLNPVAGAIGGGAIAGPPGAVIGGIIGFGMGIIIGNAMFGDDTSSDSRSIPKPKAPRCGCTCIYRADANDNIPGNIKPGNKRFAFGEATASNCAKASKEAKRKATHSLGKQPKHVGCRCSGK